MAKKKLKMTKTCIAARRRYRAKKAGVPTGTRKTVRRKRPTGTRRRGHGKPSHYPRRRGAGWGGFKNFDFGLDNRILTSLNSKMVAGVGAGFFKKRRRGGRGRGRGRGRARGTSKRGARGAGFWDDVGQTLINVGQTALQVLPLML